MDGMAEGAVTTDKETIENVFNTLSTVLGRAQTLQKESNSLAMDPKRFFHQMAPDPNI